MSSSRTTTFTQSYVITRSNPANGTDLYIFACKISVADTFLKQVLLTEPQLLALKTTVLSDREPYYLLPAQALSIVKDLLEGKRFSDDLLALLFGRKLPEFNTRQQDAYAHFVYKSGETLTKMLAQWGYERSEQMTAAQLDEIFSTSEIFKPARSRLKRSIQVARNLRETTMCCLHTIENKDWSPALTEAGIIGTYYMPILRCWSPSHAFNMMPVLEHAC